jgi:hypothetical protein
LTSERKFRRNKPAEILKKDDLIEEKLHEYFIEYMQEEYKLRVTCIDWSFIRNYPLLVKD